MYITKRMSCVYLKWCLGSYFCYCPFLRKWDLKWSSACSVKSILEWSLFIWKFEKRPGRIVSWFRFGFRFAFQWAFRVSSSRERAVVVSYIWMGHMITRRFACFIYDFQTLLWVHIFQTLLYLHHHSALYKTGKAYIIYICDMTNIPIHILYLSCRKY